MHFGNFSKDVIEQYVKEFYLKDECDGKNIVGIDCQMSFDEPCENGNYAYVVTFQLEDMCDENMSESRDVTVFDVTPEKAHLKFMIEHCDYSFIESLKTVARSDRDAYPVKLLRDCEDYYQKVVDSRSLDRVTGLKDFWDDKESKAEPKSQSEDLQLERQ